MASFILEHLDQITAELESFAREVSPASATMDSTALRDHVRQMLQAIAKDVQTWQSSDQRELKSKGLGAVSAIETAAESHGALRHTAGFNLSELVAEFRALRASVLRLWVVKAANSADPGHAYEIARFNEAIDQALAESVATYSEELAKSRDTFLAILGEDLRRPLGAIGGALDVLSKPAVPAARAAAAAVGARSVAEMSRLIRDLLEYTRTRLGMAIPIIAGDANLAKVCKAVVDEVSLIYPQTAFRFESGGRLDGVFDSARMHQVVSNLLNNAVQHGRRGYPVSVLAVGDDDNLTVQVMNKGVIEPGLLQVIFDPVVRIPATEQPASGNSARLGLGLFVAREIVRAHRGAIGATCSAHEGTTFTLELPRATSAPALERRAPAAQ